MSARLQLPPGAFAVVMATGIVSIAAVSAGRHALSWALFACAAAAWVGLVLAFAVQRPFVLHALATPQGCVGFFTFTAAGDVLAARAAAAGWTGPAFGLWIADGTAWLVLLAALGRALALGRDWSARGDWLLVVVSTQSLAVVGAELAERGAVVSARLPALALFALGLALYPPIALAAAARVRRASFRPDDWILMGALAISSLAGSQLVHLHELPHTVDLAVWAAACAWVPLLALLELRAVPRLRYEARRWSAVFPLGMLASASFAVDRTGVGEAFFWIALVAWAATAVGAALQLR